MIKSGLFLLCVLFVVQTKSDGCSGDFFKCFSDFANTFFQKPTDIEHVKVSDDLPKDLKQVKDVDIKTIKELTESIQDELFKQLKARAEDAFVVTDNPKTKIYVKTFSHYFEDSFLPNFENINLESDDQKVLGQTSTLQEQETDEKGVSEQSTYLNQLSTSQESILNTHDEEKTLITTTENAKETVNIEKISSVAEQISNITSKKPENSTITADSTTVLPETSVANDNEKEQDALDDFATITTKIIDFIINKEVFRPQIKSINGSSEPTLSNDEQKPEEKELIPKCHPDITSKTNTDNNDTSNINNRRQHKTPDDKSTTPNRNTLENTEKPFDKNIRYNLIQTDDESDYDIEDATDYPQIDYIDLYKDTTNEENEYAPTDSPKSDAINIKDEIVENVEEYSLQIDTALDNDTSTNICHGNTSDVSNIFPWIATIFVKNDTLNNQFQYTCDGALLGGKLLITAARCVTFNNATVKPDDVLVFLGKRSLQNIGEGEINIRISQIRVHSNFSAADGTVSNDLALLVMEERVLFNDGIRPACLGNGDDAGKSATTSWDLSGALTPVLFEKNKNENCVEQNADGTFCATYGNEVALCPSYGGLYASRRASRWYLQGIRSGAPERGLCFDKTVFYTPLGDHLDWIADNME